MSLLSLSDFDDVAAAAADEGVVALFPSTLCEPFSALLLTAIMVYCLKKQQPFLPT
jgi:hypothetical protein